MCPATRRGLVLLLTGASSEPGLGAPTRDERTGPGMPPSIGAARRNPVSCSHDERSEEHTSELQSHLNLVCRLLLEKKEQVAARQLNGVRPRSLFARALGRQFGTAMRSPPPREQRRAARKASGRMLARPDASLSEGD